MSLTGQVVVVMYAREYMQHVCAMQLNGIILGSVTNSKISRASSISFPDRCIGGFVLKRSGQRGLS